MQQAAVNLPTKVRVGSRTVRVQQRLGNGAFGVVYKVKDEANDEVYALKDVLCLNASALRNAVREATTLNKISHQNVIAIIGADQFRDSEGLHMLLLTEYCSGRSLNDRLARPSSEDINMKWIRQTAAALAHLHSRGVVHRDLKADNVLLTATEDVKLADFGLAREYIALKRIDVNQDEGSSWLKSYTQYYMNSGVGPLHWVAPEVFTGRYTAKADVFSLGTLFFAILERDFIVIDGKAIYGAFVNNPRGEGKLGLGFAMADVDSSISIMFSSHAQGSNAVQRVVLEALQYDRNDRPSAQELYDKIMNIRQGVRLQQQKFSPGSQQQRRSQYEVPFPKRRSRSNNSSGYNDWSRFDNSSGYDWYRSNNSSGNNDWSRFDNSSGYDWSRSNNSTGNNDWSRFDNSSVYDRYRSNNSMASTTDSVLTTSWLVQDHGSNNSMVHITDSVLTTPWIEQHHGSNNSMVQITDSVLTTPWIEQHHGSNNSMVHITDSVLTTPWIEQHHGSNNSMVHITDSVLTTPWIEQHHGSNNSMVHITDSVLTTPWIEQHHGSNNSMVHITDSVLTTPWIEQHHGSNNSMVHITDSVLTTPWIEQHHGSNNSMAQITDSVLTTPWLELHHGSNSSMAQIPSLLLIPVWLQELLLFVTFGLFIFLLQFLRSVYNNWVRR